MSKDRQHRPTAELRAIQPASPRNVRLRLPGGMLMDDPEAALIAADFVKYEHANWRYPGRRWRRTAGMHGLGFQRLSAGGRHVRGPHAPSITLPPAERPATTAVEALLAA